MIVHPTSCNIASTTNGNAAIPYKGVLLQLDATSEMDVYRLGGCGVTVSTVGFEPINPGSTPGTLASLELHTGYSVVDIMAFCEVANLGSNLSTPAKSKIKEK